MEVRIAGDDGNYVMIDVLRYEGTADQEDWYTCEVSVHAHGFQGSVQSSLAAYELASLLDELQVIHKDLSGRAGLSLIEGDLTLSIEMDNGTASIEGTLVRKGEDGARLAFSFTSDQTFLRRTMVDIEGVLQAFPTRVSS